MIQNTVMEFPFNPRDREDIQKAAMVATKAMEIVREVIFKSWREETFDVAVIYLQAPNLFTVYITPEHPILIDGDDPRVMLLLYLRNEAREALLTKLPIETKRLGIDYGRYV